MTSNFSFKSFEILVNIVADVSKHISAIRLEASYSAFADRCDSVRCATSIRTEQF